MRFKWADDPDAQSDMDNQRAWEQMLVDVQGVSE
jgi:hypothetical protein